MGAILDGVFEKLEERIRTEFDEVFGSETAAPNLKRMVFGSNPERDHRVEGKAAGRTGDERKPEMACPTHDANLDAALRTALDASEAKCARYKKAYENLRDMIRDIDLSRI